MGEHLQGAAQKSPWDADHQLGFTAVWTRWEFCSE